MSVYFRYTCKMKKISMLLILVFLLAACTAKPQENPPSNFVETSADVVIVPEAEATILPDSPVQELSLGSLTARIFSDYETTVNNVPYHIQGQANRDVVVTVNEVIFTSPADAVFTLPVDLEEGPNLIEVIMSDQDGNEVSFTLTIIYEP
ncbi:MAG: hypothetical protein C0396_04130 [Anaerolinea sp.]|nr:hypothetical protein [Anaerolinea sp.]